jgi:hypothetical protein
MTKGCVIFAQNNSEIDYIKLAVYAADRVIKFLEIPVSIVTDNKNWLIDNYPDHRFDQIIEITNEAADKKNFYDGSLNYKTVDWKNATRSRVFELTPYDKTLVIDSDYIISSKNLKIAFENDYDFQIFRNSFDIVGWRKLNEFNRINQYSVPFYWATVFVFEKNIVTESFFDLVTYIKHNWKYFRVLYNVDTATYRNDISFSIAINIMNGKTNGEFAIDLPGKKFYTIDRDVLISIDNTQLKFLIEKERSRGEYLLASIADVDVHVMNKFSLSRVIDGEKIV